MDAVEGLRENRALCEITSYRYGGKEDNLTRGFPSSPHWIDSPPSNQSIAPKFRVSWL